MIEAVLPSFYLPGYGLRGVPMYLFGNTDEYRDRVYSEPSVGLSAEFRTVVAAVKDRIAVSPPIADFWRLEPGSQMLLGLDPERRAELSGVAVRNVPPRRRNSPRHAPCNPATSMSQQLASSKPKSQPARSPGTHDSSSVRFSSFLRGALAVSTLIAVQRSRYSLPTTMAPRCRSHDRSPVGQPSSNGPRDAMLSGMMGAPP